MSVLAIVPARVGSKGIPRKNFRDLAGRPPWMRAVTCAWDAGIIEVVVSSDATLSETVLAPNGQGQLRYLKATAPLHTDQCAMVEVIKDVLARLPGPEEQVCVLLQPTQPLREPKHVQAAIALLEESKADSVVSVVELPKTHHPTFVCEIIDGTYIQRREVSALDHVGTMRGAPGTRQAMPPVYIRDGTVYVFRRRTVTRHGDIYGNYAWPFIIDPRETCPLDSAADWVDAERRLREREAPAHR
jgi:CMP-N,N'-diacetyllegionaminic acid synthase